MVLRLDSLLAPSQTGPEDNGGQIEISPDGSMVVYPGGPRKLYIRRIDEPEPRVLANHWGSRDACFSPDSRHVAYFTGNDLRRMPVDGGESQILIKGLPGHAKGACWTTDGILYSPASNAGLWRISATGGEPVQLTRPNADQGELSHRWPWALPDGRSVLFTIKTRDINSFDDAKVAVLDLPTKRWRILIDGGTYARYASTGHLIWARAGKLYAAPFDLGAVPLSAAALRKDQARVVIDGVCTQNVSGAAMYGFSEDGTLVYMVGGATETRQELVWVDRENRVSLALTGRGAFQGDLAMSPDGRRVAVPSAGANDSVWVFDIENSEIRRVTFDGNCGSPTWSSDSRELWFLSDRGGRTRVFAQPVDSSGKRTVARAVYESPDLPLSYWPQLNLSPDDRWLAMARGGDVVLMRTDDMSTVRPLAATSGVEESHPAFSPNGEYVAYLSDEAGSHDIYVRAVRHGSKTLVARASGLGQLAQPRWSADGTRLFYLLSETIYEVPIRWQPRFSAGRPRKLVTVQNASGFCPHPDGQRFLVCRRLPLQTTWGVRVVVNWFASLRSR